jgi:phosphohistidine phosphatase
VLPLRAILRRVRVYVVRHAEAAPGEPDELRKLTAAGREQARALAERLAREEPPLDALLTSPLLRAQETAATIADATALQPQVDERLAPGATAADLRAAVEGRGERVAVVGHQPDCSEIAAELTGERVRFPPGGLHAIDLDSA